MDQSAPQLCWPVPIKEPNLRICLHLKQQHGKCFQDTQLVPDPGLAVPGFVLKGKSLASLGVQTPVPHSGRPRSSLGVTTCLPPLGIFRPLSSLWDQTCLQRSLMSGPARGVKGVSPPPLQCLASAGCLGTKQSSSGPEWSRGLWPYARWKL